MIKNVISRKFLFIFHRMAAATNNSEDDKFNEELHWCIEYLELKLPKVGEKQGTKPTLNFFVNQSILGKVKWILRTEKTEQNKQTSYL